FRCWQMPPPFAHNHTLDFASSTFVNKEVPWPSILWALLPMAFNSMTQPAGRIAVNIAAEHSLFLRASPFVCVMEASAVLWQFASYTIRTGNARLAASHISQAKHGTSAGVGRTQLQELQINDVFRAILFLVGVVPQAIKLYACKGIPASQTWASPYLGSWTILELLVVIPARYGVVAESEHLALQQSSTKLDAFVEFICYIAVHFRDFMTLHMMRSKLEEMRQLNNPLNWFMDYVTFIIVYGGYLFCMCLRIIAPVMAGPKHPGTVPTFSSWSTSAFQNASGYWLFGLDVALLSLESIV
ncbi:MAG: hypothetical protein Q9204_004960, partial [Flavoplaca sp. TL-2023a]